MIPNLTSGSPKLRVAGGDAQVAAERHLERAADARAVDLADDWLGHLFAEVGALQEDGAERAQHAGPAGGVGELDEVDAGGEDRSLAAQHHAVDRRLGGGLAQRLAERKQQLLAHRVALLRAVQHHVPDRAAVLGEDDAHGATLLSMSVPSGIFRSDEPHTGRLVTTAYGRTPLLA